MKVEVEQPISRDLECAICMDPIRLPLALPCMHVFCLPCIQLVRAKSTNQVCPTCRHPLTPLPEAVANKLQTHTPLAQQPVVADYRKEGLEIIAFLAMRISGMAAIAGATIILTHPEILFARIV